MLIKWIVAEVLEEKRESFFRAQRAWNGLRSLKGFITQAGGWEQQSPGQAAILACWRDTLSYDAFVQNPPVALAANQTGTYAKAETLLGSVITTINEKDPRVFLPQATFLRVADVTLRPDFSPIFMAAQMQIWNPALGAAPGMLGLLFARVTGHKERFISASFWKDPASQDLFRREIYPTLYDRARPDDYLQRLTVYLVSLEPVWSVIGD